MCSRFGGAFRTLLGRFWTAFRSSLSVIELMVRIIKSLPWSDSIIQYQNDKFFFVLVICSGGILLGVGSVSPGTDPVRPGDPVRRPDIVPGSYPDRIDSRLHNRNRSKYRPDPVRRYCVGCVRI